MGLSPICCTSTAIEISFRRVLVASGLILIRRGMGIHDVGLLLRVGFIPPSMGQSEILLEVAYVPLTMGRSEILPGVGSVPLTMGQNEILPRVGSVPPNHGSEGL